MNVLVIDAGARRSAVSRAVESAARSAEAAGAHVTRVRLDEREIRFCTSCGCCGGGGACKIDDDLPSLAALIAESDGVIFGTPGYFRRANESTKALLDRLSGYFGAHARGAETRACARGRSAVVITACSAPEPFATFFGYSTGPVRELRRALEFAGLRLVGSLSVTDLWRRSGPDAVDEQKASSLGRILVGRM